MTSTDHVFFRLKTEEDLLKQQMEARRREYEAKKAAEISAPPSPITSASTACSKCRAELKAGYAPPPPSPQAFTSLPIS